MCKSPSLSPCSKFYKCKTETSKSLPNTNAKSSNKPSRNRRPVMTSIAKLAKTCGTELNLPCKALGLISLATFGPLCLRITFLRKGTSSSSASPSHTVGALSRLISFNATRPADGVGGGHPLPDSHVHSHAHTDAVFHSDTHVSPGPQPWSSLGSPSLWAFPLQPAEGEAHSFKTASRDPCYFGPPIAPTL